jgi:hypothetical protein
MRNNKIFVFIFTLLTLHFCGYSQEPNSIFFDEFSISVNRTYAKDDNTRYGFGFGAYHSFMAEKMLTPVLGLEYNRTSQFFRSMYEGHYAYATDVTYHINCLSIPFGLRCNIGKKIKFIIESGGFSDLIITANRKGIMHTDYPDENNNIIHKETQINEKAKLSSSVGVYLGLGIRIPVSKHELILRPEYKFGLNAMYSHMDNIYNRYIRLFVGLNIR